MKKNNLKSLIFAVLFLLITLVSFYLTLRQMNIYNQEFLTLTNEYKEKEARSNQIKELNKVILEIGDKIEILDSHFLHSADLAPFLDELESSAKNLGVKAEVISVDNPTVKNQYLSLNLRTLGTFEDLNRFLLLLENHKYELEVFEVKIIRELSTDLTSNSIPIWSGYFRIKVISFLEN